jgi:glycosyltransferase involved in cell wall biosynthesis
LLSPVSLSFVIPAHNEEDFIENTLDTLNSAVANELPTYEIVVVNDGSRDKTLLNVTR